MMKSWSSLLACLLIAGFANAAGKISQFGPQVLIFNEHMPQAQIQAALDKIAQRQIDNHFGSERAAILFEPGTYGSAAQPLNFQVGYYTAVAGLGASPRDVVINGTVQVRNRCFQDACLALDNFWRSLSNVTIAIASRDPGCGGAQIWAVSQAAPARRIRVTGGNFKLSDACSKPSFSSGGYIADSQFEGTVESGTQQQFLVRNSRLSGWSGGNWNQVFAGVEGAPEECFPAAPRCGGPYTTLETNLVTREAPFLYHSGREYRVWLPRLARNTRGVSWLNGQTPGRPLSLAGFFVATPKHSAKEMNAALAQGKNLLLTPGAYELDETLLVGRDDAVVLGLGFPTLLPRHGILAMKIKADQGVSLCGVLFDAGAENSPVLLQVGESGRHSHAAALNPNSLHDVFFRIGGVRQGKAAVSLLVESDHTILDHIWAWRADHGNGVGWTENTAETGLIVNGDDVTAYGLFVEHYQKHEVLWRGDHGRLVFFQNELPYDPPSQQAWTAPEMQGYAALKVDDSVQHFQGWALGSYSYFNRGVPIHASSAFLVPEHLAPGSLQNAFTIFLNAQASGSIDHVVNQSGGASTAANPDIPVVVLRYP